MFVNKVNTNFYPQKTSFKGYDHEINSLGDRVLRFNYPFDYENERCFVEFFNTEKDDTAYVGHKVIENDNPPKIEIEQSGTVVKIEKLLKLKKNDAFAYRIVITDKNGNNRSERVEAGTHVNDGKYILVTRNGLKPMNKGGKGVLTMPDSHLPGAVYAPFNSQKPGEIIYDKERQKQAEKTIRTYNNRYGGGLAGIHLDLPRLHKEGVKVLSLTPFANGATSDYHGYWNENNNQMIESMGNIENFDALIHDSFKYGIRIMFDYTFTSEGLNGIHYQYALRWGEKDPYAKYLFTTDSNVTLGIVPFNQENLRHKIENSPVLYEQDSKGIIKIKENHNYDNTKETYFIPTEVSDKLDKLESNSYQDSVISYRLQLIDPKSYETRLRTLSEYNKTADKPIMVDSPEGTIFLATNCAWSIDKDSAGAVMWDANVDMVKRNHGISGYDEVIMQAEPSITRREITRKNKEKGAMMNTDMDMQTIHRWAGRVKDQQILYVAQTLKGAKTAEDINKLIEKGLLPSEASLSSEKVENIIDEWYQLSPTGLLSKDDVTLRAIMKLPLDAIEVAPITAGVLSSPFFSNRAINEKTIGKTKFELMKAGNPHLEQPYVNVYTQMEDLYKNELKDFTYKVIESINKNSTEKLLDKNGNYTEFGENVVSIIGQDIARYALLKAIGGDNFEIKIDESTGVIHYNYPKLKENTGLLALGINASTPEDEALKLFKKIKGGLKTLDNSDIQKLASSFGTKLDGMVTTDLRLAKAIYTEASLGLDGRLDALKDNIDMDAVRNRYNSFDDAWSNLIVYCRYLIDAYKEENPGAVITAEITDVSSLLRKTYGESINFSDPSKSYQAMAELGSKFKTESDAISQLIQDSGITTEAGYSYFFTSVIEALSRNFENGNGINSIHGIMKSLNTLITTRNLDYIKNLFTFVGNHDKARVAHYFALNMQQFHGDFTPFDLEGKTVNYEQNKWQREQAMMRLAGVDKLEDMPLEFRLNVNNPDYFMTVSPRAVAMATLLNDAINQNLSGDKITNVERDYLKKAIADLTDGKYLKYGDNISRQVLQIDELKSIKGAIDKIMSIAKNNGLNISESKENDLKNSIIKLANSNEMLYKHLVQGEFNWTGEKSWVANINKDQARYVLTGADGKCEINDDKEFDEYSLYVVCLAALIKEALDVSNVDENIYKSVSEAIKQFVKIYNRKTVEAKSSKFPYAETPRNARRKDGFAAREIDVCADMVLEQAKYLAKQNKEEDLFKNSEELSTLIYSAAVEPGIQKLGISLSILSALPGVMTYFAGDELGATGGEDKSKNVYNQQRNARKVSELFEGAKKEIRNRIKKYVDYSMEIKSCLGVDALNSGTPYVLKTSSDDVPAILYQNAKGDMAISIINLTGYDHANRINYFERLKLQNAEERATAFEQNSLDSIVSVNPDNPMVPIQKAYSLSYIELPPEIKLPVDTVFYNAVKGCETDEFIVKYIEKKGRKFLGLIRNKAQGFGENIVINGKTGRNGVMVLKKVAKVAFKGNNINKQYNVTCPIYKNYSIDNSKIVGKNLSILAD